MEGYCNICGKYSAKIDVHHLICGINRQDSDSEKLLLNLCPDCHTMGKSALHKSGVAEQLSKMLGQALWERNQLIESIKIFDEDFATFATEDTRARFRKTFGRSWL